MRCDNCRSDNTLVLDDDRYYNKLVCFNCGVVIMLKFLSDDELEKYKKEKEELDKREEQIIEGIRRL